LNVSFEDVEYYCVFIRGKGIMSLRAASHSHSLTELRSKSTSDQCDESDLLKFIQNQIRAK